VDNDKMKSKERMKAVLRVGSRIVTTGVCVITAILLPGFGKVMAFLGSFSAFLICIILPVSPLPLFVSIRVLCCNGY
jgi:vesicular inhibitory amino acid transporter